VSSVAPINAWAAKVTKGLITQPIPPGTPFNMVITNAVYFKGDWLYAFDKKATTQQSFTTLANTKVLVPMMTKRFTAQPGAKRPVLYADTPTWTGVKLPYAGSNLSALILLPKGAKPSIAALPISDALQQKPWTAPQELDVQLPRFKTKNDLKLSAVGKQFGRASQHREQEWPVRTTADTCCCNRLSGVGLMTLPVGVLVMPHACNQRHASHICTC
jgi:serpin B